MKAKDITPGTVWAEERYQWSSPSPIAVLAPLDAEHLYGRAGRYGPPAGKPYYTRRDRATRPHRGQGYGDSDTGWPAVKLGYLPQQDSPLTCEDRVELLSKLTLDDFLKATSPSDSERGIEFFLLLSTRNITGPYAERQAAWEQAQRDKQAAEVARQEQQRQAGQRVRVIEQRFAGHGIQFRYYGHVVSPAELETILARLDEYVAQLSRMDAGSGYIKEPRS